MPKSTIKCGPIRDGRRQRVNCACNEKCKHYKRCVKDLGLKKIIMKFIEVKPTNEERSVCDTHKNYKGEEVIWKMVPKKKGIIKIIAETFVV